MTRILLALLIALCLLPLGGWAEEAIIFCQNEECNNFNLNDWVKANPPKDQPKADSNYKGWLDSGEEIHLPRSKDDDRLQSYAENCDYWMGVMERRILEQKHDSFADVATAYCTRALLEEMKK